MSRGSGAVRRGAPGQERFDERIRWPAECAGHAHQQRRGDLDRLQDDPFLDEHPDSINDGWFVFCTGADPTERTAWSDLPASYHNGAGGFAFADGHSEIAKWRAGSTKRAVVKNTSDFPVAVGTDKRDIEWVAQRTTSK